MESYKIIAIIKAVLSSIVWGLGQLFNRQFIKAAMFFFVFLTILGIEFATGNYGAEFNLYEDKLPGEEVKEEVSNGFIENYYYNLLTVTGGVSGTAGYEDYSFLTYVAEVNGLTFDVPTQAELDDLDTVINWVCSNIELSTEANINNITLLGHSRGGGIVIIKAAEDSRIKAVISLAGVSDYKNRFPVAMAFDKWKNEGVYFVENARTKQQMPHYFQFYEDFIKNESRLTIQSAAKNLNIPFLIIHGDADTSVSIDEAKNLYQWHPNSTLEVIKGANHVFGASHPWNANYLPKHLQKVIDLIKSFNK